MSQIETARTETLLPFLPLLRWREPGQPEPEVYSLELYKPLEIFFKLRIPPHRTVKKGRQIAASTTQAAQTVLLASAIPGLRMIYVAPEAAHAEYWSRERLSPILTNSPFIRKSMCPGPSDSVNNLMYKKFANGSSVSVSYYLNNIDRLRGMTGDFMILDEAQLADPAEIQDALSCLSNSVYGVLQTTGTPTTTTSFLQERWELSSQAEWGVKCHSCGYWNIPSVEQDLLKMITSMKGPVCAKCGALVNPDDKSCHWIHAFPDRRRRHEGYHAPQIIFPKFFAYRHKWEEFQEQRKHMPEYKFYNECLGEPKEAGATRLSVADLKACCTLPPLDSSDGFPGSEAIRRSRNYQRVILGIDWGGKGEARATSRTVVAAVGKNPGQPAECFWAHIFSITDDMGIELKVINHAYKVFRCAALGHDFRMGPEYEWALRMHARDIPGDKIYGIAYGLHPGRSLMYWQEGERGYYALDKTRSLLVLIDAIKGQRIRFPAWESCQHILQDLISLRDEYSTSRTGSGTLLITRTPNQPDDFAHALNFAIHLHAYIVGAITGDPSAEYRYLLSGQSIPIDELLM